MKIDKKTLILIAVLAIVAGIVIKFSGDIFSAAVFLLSVTKPVIMGFCIAYILNIIVSFYETKLLDRLFKNKRKKLERAISIILAFVSIIIIALIVLEIVIPQLISALGQLLSSILVLFENLQDFVADNQDVFGFLSDDLSNVDFSFDKEEIVEKVYDWAKSGGVGLVKDVSSFIVSFFTGAINFIMSLFIAVYVLAGKETLKRQFKKLINNYLKPNIQKKSYYVIGTANTSFRSFFIGQCIEAVIIGVLCTLGMLILRLPYAGMIGVMIGSTALIPIAGAYIGGAVGTIIIFAQSSFIQAVIFVIFIVVLQQVEGQLIYPKVVGTSIGLPGLWVMSAVMIGGGLFGILGIIIGIPITSTIYRLLGNDIAARENKTKKEKKAVQNANT